MKNPSSAHVKNCEVDGLALYLFCKSFIYFWVLCTDVYL